jgi:hypothetical protein
MQIPDVLLCLVPAASVEMETFCAAPDGFKVICVTPIATAASVDKYEATGPTGGGVGTRQGFGVRAAFTVTQHKCQGQTIYRPVAHWKEAKAMPAADYVTLSRAVSLVSLAIGEMGTHLGFRRLQSVGYDRANDANRKPTRKPKVRARMGQVEAIVDHGHQGRNEAKWVDGRVAEVFRIPPSAKTLAKPSKRRILEQAVDAAMRQHRPPPPARPPWPPLGSFSKRLHFARIWVFHHHTLTSLRLPAH